MTHAKAKPSTRNRQEIAEEYRWNRADIFSSWDEWERAHERLHEMIETYSGLKGTLGSAEGLLHALKLSDEVGQLAYRVYFYPSLAHDEDQRDNAIDAYRQKAQIVLAKLGQKSAWFNPELLKTPLETIIAWADQCSELAVYRFALEEIYRQREHVLDAEGERILSLASRLDQAPADAYSALTTADVTFPKITLSDGGEVTVSYGVYRSILAENRNQKDRQAAFRAHYSVYRKVKNTAAALYSGVAERDWFVARARNYATTLDAALHQNDIPTQVVDTLVESARAGTAPLKRYHQLRKKALGLDCYYLFDGTIALIDYSKTYYYDDVTDWICQSVARLGEGYQRRVKEAFSGRWIDVYENEGKRSGAYSASVYGVHPYMLLNYNDTLDDMFTLAHEMGHTLHTMYAYETQPFVYADYTIFVAEVASTLSEAFLLEFLLSRSQSPQERVVLLQHAIDSICSTFFSQVLFADWELRVHRDVEQGRPLTAERLSETYQSLLNDYYGESIDSDDLYALTWARIPHFFRSPYYVYQYATSFAASAHLFRRISTSNEGESQATVEQYLDLLRSGGSEHPMPQLKKAGVDLSRSETIQAVVDQMDDLVSRLEADLAAL